MRHQHKLIVVVAQDGVVIEHRGYAFVPVSPIPQQITFTVCFLICGYQLFHAMAFQPFHLPLAFRVGLHLIRTRNVYMQACAKVLVVRHQIPFDIPLLSKAADPVKAVEKGDVHVPPPPFLRLTWWMP